MAKVESSTCSTYSTTKTNNKTDDSMDWETLEIITSPKRTVQRNLFKDQVPYEESGYEYIPTDDAETNSLWEESGSEYIPSSESDSEIEQEYEESDTLTRIEGNHIINREQRSDEVSCLQETNTLIKHNQGIDSLTVPTSQPRGQKKIWCCPFCKDRVTKFARHLERRHRSEEKVKKFLQLPSKHKDRLTLISELRNKGTFIHNMDSSLNKGQIIVSRRPHVHMGRKASDYIPCPSCNGFYKKDSLYKHTKNCGVNPVLVRGVQQVSRSLLVNEIYKNNDTICHLLAKLRSDEITNEIKNDSLILLFGSYLCEKYVKDLHLDAFLRQKLRQLGRFLIAAKEINSNIKNLESLLQPKEYDTVINAIRKICGFDIKRRHFKKPVLALNIGSILTQCAKFYIGQCIRESNTEKQKLVENFIHIHKIEYSSRISRTATAVQKEASWNKAQELSLPQAEDIERMVSFLKIESAKAYQELKAGFNKISWCALAGTTLLRVLMFNRKRVGELERLLIKNYEDRQGILQNSDAFRTLCPIEQALCHKFKRVEIRGKKGRRVPILLDYEQIQYIDKILELRTEAGVPVENPYVFGKLGNDYTHRHFSACKLLRDYSSKSGANVPANLRGTKLRKQISTICQVMELSENDVQLLADYLGHDVAIHKAHYRTPELTLQVSKIAKVLIAAEDKHIEKYRGQCLNTLEVDMKKANSTDTVNEVDVFNKVSHSHQIGSTEINKLSIPLYQSPQMELSDDSNSSQDEEKNSIKSKYKKKNQEKPKSDESNSAQDKETNIKNEYKKNNQEKQILGKVIRRTWITPEKQAIRQRFSENLHSGYLPSLNECQDAIKTDKRLSRRTPDQVKAWVNNQVRSRRRLHTE